MDMDMRNWFQKKSDAPHQVEIPAVSRGSEDIEQESTGISNSLALNYYTSNTWVRKYVNTIVNGMLRYKLQAVLIDGADPNDQANVDALKQVNLLLTYANESETFGDVRSKYLKDFILFGNGTMEISPKNGHTVKNLYAAPGAYLKIMADESGNISKGQAYGFIDPKLGDVAEGGWYSLDDIVHFKMDALSDRLFGQSPISASSYELLADSKAAKEMGRGDFGVTPQLLIMPKATKNFVDSVLRAVQQVITGRAGNKIVTASAEDLKTVKLSGKEYKDEFEFQKWLVQRHNVYGIPPFKLGFVSDVGSQSAKEQREEFLTLIELMVTYECEKLSLVLCSQKLKLENVKIVAPALVTRVDYEKSRVLDRLVSVGIITPNEARSKYLGLPRVEDPLADKLRQ